MKHVSILILHDALMSSIVDPHTVFNGVNAFLEETGKVAFFKVEFVGLSSAVKFNNDLFSVNTNALITEIKKTDLIIIPAIEGDLATALQKNKEFIPWIIQQHEKGAEVASLCSGAFVLASTGLLNGKECSSHWTSAQLFREMFPQVDLVEGRIVTEQDGLYSSGGSTSYLNLLLHLVEKYVGREIAILASKVYAIQIDRKTQSPFIMFNGQKEHEDESVRKAQEFIEKNVTGRILIDELSSKFGIDKRQFERRFKKATNNTPSEYIQRVKIEAAKKNLETSMMNVNEVMYGIGYSDPKYFRSIFKKLTGILPAEYRKKYNKTAAVHGN